MAVKPYVSVADWYRRMKLQFELTKKRNLCTPYIDRTSPRDIRVCLAFARIPDQTYRGFP